MTFVVDWTTLHYLSGKNNSHNNYNSNKKSHLGAFND